MNTLALIVDIMATGVECYFGYLFCAIFIDISFFREKKEHFLLAAICGVVVIQLLGENGSFGVVKSILGLFLGFYLFQVLVYRKYYLKCLVFTLIFAVMDALIDFCIVGVSCNLSGVSMNAFQSISVYRIICTILSKTLLILIVSFITRIVRTQIRLNKKYIVLIFLLSGSIFLMSFLIFQRFLQLNRIEVTDVIIFIVLLSLSLFSFFYILRLAELYEEKEAMSLLHLHDEMMLAALDENRKNYDAWSKKIHDYKNHIIYMTELADQNKYEELSGYLHTQMGDIKGNASMIKTGYAGIDAIINAKQIVAISKALHLFCNISIPSELQLDNARISTILGNLIDNAIRAAAEIENATVEVTIHMVKNNLCIKICNPTKREHIDFAKSTKKTGLHGVGLQSVKQCCMEIGGDFIIEEKNGMVTAFVTLFDVPKKVKSE